MVNNLIQFGNPFSMKPLGRRVVLSICIIQLTCLAHSARGITKDAPTIVVENGNVNSRSSDSDTAGLHNSRPSFLFKIDEAPKMWPTQGKEETLSSDENMSAEDGLTNNSIEGSSWEIEDPQVTKIYDGVERLVQEIHSKSHPHIFNTLDLDVITQAFRFVKLDSHLNALVTQLNRLQDMQNVLLERMLKQDSKFEIMQNKISQLVNLESGKKKEDKIETQIQKMSHKLDQAVEKMSFTTSQFVSELSKNSLSHMEKVQSTSKEVLKEVKAVKEELNDVGQASVQTIYNLHKLEENLMLKLAKAGRNRTVYALRTKDAQVIGPRNVLLEDGYQADLSLVGGSGETITKAESLVSCLSRKGLIKERRPRDCGEIQLLGHSGSGVYTIFPSIKSDPTEVFCDLDTEGGGWTVIQSRTEQPGFEQYESFHRPWTEYKRGFGSPQKKQHWLGLDNISEMSRSRELELRIEMMDWSGALRTANYAYFRIGNESDKFQLHVTDYSGSAGDSLTYHNGMPFSAKDQDNDQDGANNCAERYHGAFWYKNCHQSNLNGIYMGGGRHKSYAQGIIWYSWHGYYYSLRQVEMKIRTRLFSILSSTTDLK